MCNSIYKRLRGAPTRELTIAVTVALLAGSAYSDCAPATYPCVVLEGMLVHANGVWMAVPFPPSLPQWSVSANGAWAVANAEHAEVDTGVTAPPSVQEPE